MFRLLKKYYCLDKKERKILSQTFFWLMYGFILARFIPLKWFDKLLGEFRKEDYTKIDDNQSLIVRKVKRNLIRLKRKLPWQVRCFEEAIAAKKVLEKYQIKTCIYLGVSKDSESKLIAHAWLKSGELFITGRNGYKKYAVVGFYS